MFSGFPGLLVCISLKEGEVSLSVAGGPPPVTILLGYLGLEQCKAWVILLMCSCVTALLFPDPAAPLLAIVLFPFLYSSVAEEPSTRHVSLQSLALRAPEPALPARVLFGAVKLGLTVA